MNITLILFLTASLLFSNKQYEFSFSDREYLFNEILAIKNFRSGDKLKIRIWRRGRYLNRTIILG